MALNSNQFNITQLQGSLDLMKNPNIVSGIIAASETEELVAGEAVTKADVAGELAQFLGASSNDPIFGFIVRNPKESSYSAKKPVEIAWTNSVMWMTAGEAIPAMGELEYNATDKKVVNWDPTSGNTKIGFAYDKASADNELIRVLIETPQMTKYFTELADVTGAYSGNANDHVAVKADETGLEFVAP